MRIPIVYCSLGSETPIVPSEPLPVFPEIPRGSLAVIEGRAPIWQYGRAFHLLHGSPAIAIGTYDPRLGVVIIATHTPLFREGEVLDIPLGQDSVER